MCCSSHISIAIQGDEQGGASFGWTKGQDFLACIMFTKKMFLYAAA